VASPRCQELDKEGLVGGLGIEGVLGELLSGARREGDTEEAE